MTPAQLLAFLRAYAGEVRRIRADPAHHPETSLYPLLQTLLESVLAAFRQHVEIRSQRRAEARSVPDFTLLDRQHPFGWIEAKAPDHRVDERRRFHDQELVQFDRYAKLPSVVYTNFHEATLFVEGQPVESAQLVAESDLAPEGRGFAGPSDIGQTLRFFERVASFEPPPMTRPAEVAAALARRARLVREVVTEVVREQAENPLQELFREFEDILFKSLSAEQFADAYAQTLTYGLLLAHVSLDFARDDRAGVGLSLDSAPRLLEDHHRLLSGALRLLGQPEPVRLIGWSVEALIETVRRVDVVVLSGEHADEALLYFYEQFLAAYDPVLRRKVGVYFTPPEVVAFQVRACEELLASELGIDTGFASDGVNVLDPATGTGTYLLGIVREVARRAREEQGQAAVRGALESLVRRIFAFELLVGPYSVARWRLGTMFRSAGVTASPQVVLTDTLVPATMAREVTPQFGFLSRALSEERQRADHLKQAESIMVILGNPPYGRTRLNADDEPGEEAGRWDWIWRKVDDFRRGLPQEERVNIRNLADRYVLFWRWGFWKLLDPEASGPGRGIVTFITNRSYLSGGAFSEMRRFMRESFDRVDIVDLGGDQRAGRRDDAPEDQNVFEIETGVAIAVCVRKSERRPRGCDVHYRRLWGTRSEKLSALGAVRLRRGFERPPRTGGDSFIPRTDSAFHDWLPLPELFAHGFSGVQTKRDKLVVDVRREGLHRKLGTLARMNAEEAKETFHETRDRKLPPLAGFRFDDDAVCAYAYRPLDRRVIYLDDRFVEYSRSALRTLWGRDNIALVTFPRKHGTGPVAVVHANLPDINSFSSAQGTSRVFPLWDDGIKLSRRRVSNFRPERLDALRDAYGESDPKDLFYYLYGVLQAPSYTSRFSEELQQSFPRVPFPQERTLYEAIAAFGQVLVDLHTFARTLRRGEDPCRLDGESAAIDRVQFVPEAGQVVLGEGLVLTNVTQPIWGFQVSGYPVLRRWLEARIGLDLTADEINELRNVVHALRRTVELGPSLDARLDELVRAPLLDLQLG